MGAALPVGEAVPEDGSLPDGHDVDRAVLFSAYVHVPFCRVRCGYCDFNTYTSGELRGARQDRYADDVLAEIALAGAVLDRAGGRRPASTVFFGGGTPTLLPPGDLARMLGGIAEQFGVAPGAEVTVEANPDTVDDRVAETLAAAGVTRLSIGMQSAVPHVLQTLDRTHRPESVAVAVAAARRAGLAVSLDLIYGTPGETLEDWRASIDAVLELEPDHVSAYALIIEDGTALARRIRRGEVAMPDDDLQADMYELVDGRLGAAGFEWYEVSNWARTDRARSRHNLAYWRGTDWWGFGPGAHSHIAGVRFWNVKHPAAYAQRLAAGGSPAAGRERPDAATLHLERVLLRTRIKDGLDVSDLSDAGRSAVAGLIADGLIDGPAAVRGRVIPTLRGRLLADVVARALTE
jgi:putative oxygen-independent coproporphyrinogen III oxidase